MSIQEYLQQHYTATTAKTYERHIEKFQLRISNHRKAKYKEILNYVKTYRLNYVGVSALKKYFDYLIVENVRTDHPCKNLKVKEQKTVIQHQNLFSKDELELLLKRECRYAQLKNRNKVLIGLLIYQGLTVQNLIELRIEDIDLDEGILKVRKCNNLNSRVLQMKPKQMNILFQYLSEPRASGVSNLLLTKLGMRLTVDTIQTILHQLKPLFVDRKLNSITIRQSVISNWINEDGISVEDVQLLAGHKWMSTTEKYKKEDRQSKKEMINKFFPL